MIVLNGCNSANGYDIKTLQMRTFYRTFCQKMTQVLCMRVSLTYTAVTSGHGIIFMLSANVA
jgi:hypothetical protein